MDKHLKEIKKQQDEYKKKYKCDEDGRVVVDLCVHNDDNFLSPYSSSENAVLTEEVADFIENNLKNVPHDKRIKLAIHGETITLDEQDQYEKAIHRHFSESYQKVKTDKSRLTKISFIMAIIAVLVLSIMFTLEFVIDINAVAIEVIDIIAWVFMWEAVDIFFLQCAALRRKEKRYLSLIDSKIEFDKI